MLGCSCVQNGLHCLSCHPGERGSCHNSTTLPLVENSVSEATPSPHAGDLPVPGASSRPPACPSSSDVLFSPVSIRAVPPLSEIFHSRITTLFHIPKSARDSWSEVLLFALRAASDCPNDLEAWARLLMLPKCILFLPPFKARKEARFLAPNNKDWLKAWREGSYQDLLFEACKRSAHSHMPQSSSYNVRHACGAAQNVHFQKALRALGSFGLAPPDSGSFAAMLSKHPQCSPPQFSSSLMHPLPSHPSPPCSPPLFDSPPTVPPSVPLPFPSSFSHSSPSIHSSPPAPSFILSSPTSPFFSPFPRPTLSPPLLLLLFPMLSLSPSLPLPASSGPLPLPSSHFFLYFYIC